MDNLLQEFEKQIQAMLDACSPIFTPTVCSLISTTEGRESVSELIKKKVILERVTIGEAVNLIEQEFNPNSYTE